MGTLFNFDAGASYAAKIEALRAADIALWDVLHSCVRLGSLDSAIVKGSRVANDFADFFETHTALHRIAFNGAEAERSFRKYVLPKIDIGDLELVRLPSTSPAHAIPLQTKVERWRIALQ